MPLLNYNGSSKVFKLNKACPSTKHGGTSEPMYYKLDLDQVHRSIGVPVPYIVHGSDLTTPALMTPL